MICVCNKLDEAKVKEAIQSGAENPDEIVKYWNKDFRCETCIVDMYLEIQKENK